MLEREEPEVVAKQAAAAKLPPVEKGKWQIQAIRPGMRPQQAGQKMQHQDQYVAHSARNGYRRITRKTAPACHSAYG